ncbi:MAG: hypothetical protein EON58_20975, partial [Alphaproteobacteria bacterium]
MASKPPDTNLRRLLARQFETRTVRLLCPSRVDTEARTVELAFSSETDTVERWFGIEILGHAPGECDLSRLQNAAPVLWDHDKGDQRGVVVSARIDPDGVGRALVRFSRSPGGDQLFQDIVDGIVTKVSVGYDLSDLRHVEVRDGKDVYRATSWAPDEISLVSIPADDTVGVGRAREIPQEERRPRCQLSRSSDNLKEFAKPMNELTQLFDSARVAAGDAPIFDGNGNLRAVQKRRPASIAHHSMRTLVVPPHVDDPLATTYAPIGTEVGRRTTVSDAVLRG